MLDRLGMRFLITDRRYESRRYRLVYDAEVRVYENPEARDVPSRETPRGPLLAGLFGTLAGCAWGAAAAFLDRFRGRGYS